MMKLFVLLKNDIFEWVSDLPKLNRITILKCMYFKDNE